MGSGQWPVLVVGGCDGGEYNVHTRGKILPGVSAAMACGLFCGWMKANGLSHLDEFGERIDLCIPKSDSERTQPRRPNDNGSGLRNGSGREAS